MMVEIRHIENRHDVFFCRGWSNFDKISQTGAEWHVDCGDMVEIETRCRMPIWRTFWRIQWHVIPEPPATVQVLPPGEFMTSISWSQSYVWHCRVLQRGEFNVMPSQSHVSHCRMLPLGEFTVMIPQPHATLHGGIIPSAFLRRILFSFFSYCSVWASASGGFRIVSNTLVWRWK